MRELPVTLALSLAVHGVVAAAFILLAEDEPRRGLARSMPVLELTSPVEDVPVEVALLPDDTVNRDVTGELVASLAAPPTAGRRPGPARAALATGRPAPAEVPAAPAAPPPPPPPRRSLFGMRSGPDLVVKQGGQLSDAQIEAMVNGTMPTKVANLPGAQASADLDAVNAKLQNGRWVDGADPETVTGARYARVAAREALANEELVAQADGTYRSKRPAYAAKVDRDGKVHFTDDKNLKIESPLSASFDVTDAFMRKYGNDPYASDKLAYLDRTRDQRAEIGKRYRTAQLADSAQYMNANLHRLWATTRDMRARKQGVFDLWDECAETGDAEAIEGGGQARALLVRWVQVKLVGPTAFTEAELAKLNAQRRSKQVFAPYSHPRASAAQQQPEAETHAH